MTEQEFEDLLREIFKSDPSERFMDSIIPLDDGGQAYWSEIIEGKYPMPVHMAKLMEEEFIKLQSSLNYKKLNDESS